MNETQVPADGEMTNAARARRALVAVAAYCGGPVPGTGDDLDTAMRDLLGDLDHLARLSGLDYARQVSRAGWMSAQERAEDPDGLWDAPGG